MKRLFLASAIEYVAVDIARRLDTPGMPMGYITTAAEVGEGDLGWLEAGRAALVEAGFDVFNYTITGKTEAEIRQELEGVGAVCLSGGNNFYLLAKIRESGFDRIAAEWVAGGRPYLGSSAGSIVAGPDLAITYLPEDAAYAAGLASYRGLGLVDFVVLPHWGSDYFRDVYLERRLAVAYTTGHKIIPLTDYQYVCVEDGQYRIEQVEP